MNIIQGYLFEEKQCKTCKVIKPLSEYSFYKSNNGRTYQYLHCKPCQDGANRARYWREASQRKAYYKKVHAEKIASGKAKDDRLRLTYGISLADYNDMLEKQGGGCAICKGGPAGKPNFAVDHDHATGKVRALLCGRCNGGLGHFSDSIEMLQKAIAYLELHLDVDVTESLQRQS